MAKKPDPRSKKDPLSVSTLALVRGSQSAVLAAENRILKDIRENKDPTVSQDIHDQLRIASLGLLIAYSVLEGYDDPRTYIEQDLP